MKLQHIKKVLAYSPEQELAMLKKLKGALQEVSKLNDQYWELYEHPESGDLTKYDAQKAAYQNDFIDELKDLASQWVSGIKKF